MTTFSRLISPFFPDFCHFLVSARGKLGLKDTDTPRISLHDVTICAADCVNPGLAARALHASMARCEFGDAILFSDSHVDGHFRHVKIPKLCSRGDYSRFAIHNIAAHVETPFLLIVQWDGYVVDPDSWSDDFLNYDYIGARWPWHAERQVGNGGFSLRSLRLLKAVGKLLPEPPDVAEDEMICRGLGSVLERDWGIRFAPESVADRFSYERQLPGGRTFGFHGLFNLWRHVGDEAMAAIANALDDRTTRTREYTECVLAYFLQRRFDPLGAMYSRLRAQMSRDAVLSLMLQHVPQQDLITGCLEVCDRLLHGPDAAERFALRTTTRAKNQRDRSARVRRSAAQADTTASQSPALGCR
jgi:hypothetical protein